MSDRCPTHRRVREPFEPLRGPQPGVQAIPVCLGDFAHDQHVYAAASAAPGACGKGRGFLCLLELPAQLPSCAATRNARNAAGVGSVRGAATPVATRPRSSSRLRCRRGQGCGLWSYEMTESTLNAEQRRALAMLATTGFDGATQS